MNTHFSSIWPVNRTRSSATTSGQSGLGSNGNEGVLCIPQSSSITGTSPSDCLVSYLGSFFQAAVVSILLYGCTTWTLTKRLERRLDGNYTRMLRAVLNKSWRQHPTRLQLYGHLPPITKTIQVRRTRHAGHCWRSKDELISDVLLWTPAHGCAGVGQPARTYIQQLCEDTGCNPEDLPEAMDDREKWRETVRDIRAGGATWWWWWWQSQLTGQKNRMRLTWRDIVHKENLKKILFDCDRLWICKNFKI